MKLSIITINYNNKLGLEKTIDSIIRQTWKDFEWIIIDGGSTDGSRELIEETAANLKSKGSTIYQFSGLEIPASYLADYQPLINNHISPHRLLWCSEKDCGVYNAQNKGVKYSCGEYLNFMNSGDTFADTTTLEQVFKDRTLTADLVYGDWIRSYPDNEEIKFAPRQMFNFLVFFENVCHQAMFVRSSVLKRRGYDEKMKILADWKRWQEMSVDGCSFMHIPVTVCRFEALSGLSEKYSAQMTQEQDLVFSNPYLPEDLRSWLITYRTKQEKFNFYDGCILTHQAYDLIQERVLYQYLIHFSLLIIGWLKKVIDMFTSRQKCSK